VGPRQRAQCSRCTRDECHSSYAACIPRAGCTKSTRREAHVLPPQPAFYMGGLPPHRRLIAMLRSFPVKPAAPMLLGTSPCTLAAARFLKHLRCPLHALVDPEVLTRASLTHVCACPPCARLDDPYRP